MSTLLAILVANTLLAALLAGLGWLAMRYARYPSLAHCCWVLALIKLITPPVIPIPIGWKLQPERFFTESRTGSAGVTQSLANQDSSAPSRPRRSIRAEGDPSLAVSRSTASGRSQLALRLPCTWNIFAAALALLWASGSAGIALVLAWRAQAFQRSLDRCISPDGELSRRAWRLARRAGLRQAPQVLRADALLSPMLWGIGKRVQLIFPQGLLERLSEEEIDSLLLHELGHYARGDHYVRLLELLCRVLFWWHPLMWIALSQIEEAEEHCCDAWVVSHQTGQERSYAEALLGTIDFLNEEHVLARPIASGVGDARLLRKRLTEIMAGETRPLLAPASQRLAWLAGGLVLVIHPALGNVSWQWPAMRPSHLPHTVAAASVQATAGERQPLETTPTRSDVEQPPSLLPRDSQWEALRPPASLWASATSPGGIYRLEARAGRQVTLIHVASGRQIGLGNYRITCVAFSPSGKSFFTGDEEGHLREWDSETGEVLHWWKSPSREITSLQVSPDGSQLVSSSLDGLISIWQTQDQAETRPFHRRGEVISCVRWSSDGSKLAIAVGGWTENVHPELVILDLESGSELRYELEQSVGALTWLKDPNLLIAASWDGRAVVWDIEAGAPRGAGLVLKEEVSAAAWCAHCPLLLRLGSEEL